MNDGLDRDLLGLFADASRPLPAEVFTASVLAELRQARRRRVLRQAIVIGAILATCAWAAPYAAEQTLRIVGWVAAGLPESASEVALASPLGWLCGTLVTWRMLRQRFQ